MNRRDIDMTTTNKSGTAGSDPASPTHYQESSGDEFYSDSVGLTKREHFAAMAMQGLVSGVNASPKIIDIRPQVFAREAVSMADALIEALNA